MDPSRNFEESVPLRDCSARGYLEATVFYVRLDDRGDLGVYVVADNASDAHEEAEDYAHKAWGPDCIRPSDDDADDHDYVINEDDISASEVAPDVVDEVREAFFMADHGGLTRADIESLTEDWSRRKLDNARDYNYGDEEDEDDGPEVCMTSLGYVELWLDGEIVSGGVVLTTLED